MSFLKFLFPVIILVLSPETSFPSAPAACFKDTSYVIVNSITITGNRKTKEKIILREVNFFPGDTLSPAAFADAVTRSRNRVFNTGLFITVDFAVTDQAGNRKDIQIRLKERWYLYPVPIFELADRNFNEWWQERHRDPKRLNVGLYFIQKNVRGRNETLRAKVQTGFTKKAEVFYYIPYLNKKQRAGLNFEISYILNKQVAYETYHHKLVYFDYPSFLRERFRTGFNFFYRKRYYQTHFIGASFQHNAIADTLAALNPDYFLHGHTRQRYISIRYAYIKDVRDIAYYPLKGSYFKFEAEKLGLGIWKDINQLNMTAEYDLFRPLTKKIFFAGMLKQKLSFPTRQPYLQTRALGYEKDYVSGYELYVIDGQHFSLSRLNLKYRLFSTMKNIAAVPVNQFKTLPVAVYFKLHTDAGYVTNNAYNPANVLLANKLLLGGGAGIDVVSYYDFVFRLEYSVNRQGQHGVYLHFRSAI